MSQTRRTFIAGTGAALLGGALNRAGAGTPPGTVPQDIRELLQAAGFNPESLNSALLAVIGDVHINLDSFNPTYTEHFDDGLVAELNTLSPAITDLAIAGDLICHHSASIGGPRYPSHYALAKLEYRRAKTEIERFRAGLRIWAVPGNHDSDILEESAELWREELQLPPYQQSVLGGVPVFFLNTGNAGMPDPVQTAWFEAQTRLIPAAQEVVIIAHHPSMYYVFETGLRRLVSRVFARHRAPVWLVGGHGHAFGEQLLVAGDARFVQMEVTAGNPNPHMFGDRRAPGYVLLALQDGRVVHRTFRSTIDPGFQVLQPIDQLRVYPLIWPFDSIAYPAAIFEEGFYPRAGKLIEFVATDLKSQFSSCRIHTVRVDLSRARGKIVDYLFSANISPALVPPTCYFSPTGLDGSWVGVEFPVGSGQLIYRIPIPAGLRNAATLYIKTKTQLQGPVDGITVYAWGLAANPAVLTGYEKWLALQYRTIFHNALTDPTARPPGSALTNIEHFAFNVPLPSTSAVVQKQVTALGSGLPISGTPVYSRTFRNVMVFRFERRTAASQPAVSYAVEYSADLTHWSAVAEERLVTTPLDTGWEEVRFSMPVTGGLPGFCRVKVAALPESQGDHKFIAAGDHDGDGMDDLLQYAFDLRAANGRLRPDGLQRPVRATRTPSQSVRSGIFSRIVYPRIRASANPGVQQRIEESGDLRQWTPLPATSIAERVIRSDGDWEEVDVIIMDSIHSRRFYRICLELTEPLTT